ncbi:MAG: acetylxylan esterase [Myxococcaceae bacterium]|jgi:predicted dienelactone hydrolase|nr:acetylxylan esterase [Myxococcaceae bacterium]MCA3014288.1 acetylxylan esterase [Myxococcaceae bacterium]
MSARAAMLLGLALSACGAPAPVDPLPFPAAGPTAAPDPSKFGPFQVGVRTVTYEDRRRPKPDGSPRLLVTEVWYPATQDTKGRPTVSYDIKERFTDAQRAMLNSSAIPLLETIAVRDATPARSHGPFPLVVFSHGQGAIRYQSTFYTVLLASHGYVVVSPDHEGGTLDYAVRNQLQDVGIGIATRPADVQYLMTAYQRLPESDPLFGLVDPEKIGVTGHSFGALTSLRVAAIDKRVKVIVPQAPPSTDLFFLDLGRPNLGIPVMIQGARKDRTLKWDEHVAPTWSAMQKPRWLLDLSEGGHFTFSDICAFDLAAVSDSIRLDIPGANVRGVLTDGCAPPAPSAAVAQPLMNHFAVALFNATLRGSTASLELLTQAKADALAPGAAVVTADP